MITHEVRSLNSVFARQTLYGTVVIEARSGFESVHSVSTRCKTTPENFKTIHQIEKTESDRKRTKNEKSLFPYIYGTSEFFSRSVLLSQQKLFVLMATLNPCSFEEQSYYTPPITHYLQLLPLVSHQLHEFKYL